MKKLSEVCKITGVTRRALQEYDRIGLISPTDRTEAGYWLYDDAAVQKIILIQIFVEVGYERKAIKKVLEGPQENILIEMKKMIGELEAKKKRIDGMINTLNTILAPEKLPMATLVALSNIDSSMLSRIYKDGSFKEYLETSIDQSASYTDEEKKEAEEYMPFYYHLLAIGSSIGKNPKSKLVQACVKDFYEYMINIDGTADPNENWYDKEHLDELDEAMSELLAKDSELREMIDSQAGDGASEYIIKAVKTFKEIQIK